MKLLDFKGCVNLFFKITWVPTFIQKRTHCAKIVACPPHFIFCKFDVIFQFRSPHKEIMEVLVLRVVSLFLKSWSWVLVDGGLVLKRTN
jgi:hypothetical protein